MTEEPREEPIAPQQEPWKTVYFGQIAADLVPWWDELWVPLLEAWK